MNQGADINMGSKYVKFRHKVDKESIPKCNIMGVDFAITDMDKFLKFTADNIKDLSGDYICFSNVHTTVMAFENERYRMIQNGGIAAAPDGGPISSIGRKRGYKEMGRVAGPTFMEKMFAISEERGFRHFFYGTTQDTLDKMRARLEKEYPALQIAGMYSPPFRPLTDEEDEEIVRIINEGHPDFIWVGLGAPKQEIWMARHRGRVEGLMAGVGAAFDFYAGNTKRAPLWMQEHNLEWFYRLMQNPRKLVRRYVTTNAKFILHAFLLGK